MLLDQEWDTRTWNRAKVHAAVETLYGEVELSEDEKRRELATTMIVRLLETHEGALHWRAAAPAQTHPLVRFAANDSSSLQTRSSTSRPPSRCS